MYGIDIDIGIYCVREITKMENNSCAACNEYKAIISELMNENKSLKDQLIQSNIMKDKLTSTLVNITQIMLTPPIQQGNNNATTHRANIQVHIINDLIQNENSQPIHEGENIHEAQTRPNTPSNTENNNNNMNNILPSITITGNITTPNNNNNSNNNEETPTCTSTTMCTTASTSMTAGTTTICNIRGKGGFQCVLCGTFYTSRNMLRHFRIKHGNYMNGRLRDHRHYPKYYYFKTIAPRLRCPAAFRPPLKYLHNVRGIKMEFIGYDRGHSINSSDEIDTDSNN